MNLIRIKPTSVNDVWQGRRFKTDYYKKYIQDVCFLLPLLKLDKPPYRLYLEFGMSNYASDIDNPVKPFIDCLQAKYLFNDKHITELQVRKFPTAKGKEYIRFNIESILM